MIAALILIGPDNLPEIARTLGKTYAEFKRTVDDLKRNIAETEHRPEKRNAAGSVAAGDAKACTENRPGRQDSI